MTTLEKIVKEAKEIKKNYPKKFAKWTDYIKEASKKLKGSFTKKKTNIGKIKKYDLGFASKGSGTIVYNRLKQEYGDYENIAHISDFGLITIYDKKMPESVKKEIEIYNKKSMLGATKKTKITKKPIKYNDVSKRQSDIIRKEIKSKKFIMPHGYEVRRSKLGGLMSISDNAKQLIIDCIDLSGYEKNITNPIDKIRAVEKIFYTEQGYMINRVGKQKALENWLRGLPTEITLPYYNVEIIEIAKKWGSLKMNATEKQEDKILLNYWRFMANQLLQLFNKKKLNTKFT
jgi:hypothetical protein